MLARIRKRIDKEEEGFTLIELLVVIIIIGILAAIAIPVFLSQKTKGYEASMKSDLRTVAQEIESHNVDNQNYTGSRSVRPHHGTSPATTSRALARRPSVAAPRVHLSNGNTITVRRVRHRATACKATSSGPTAWYYGSELGGLHSSRPLAPPPPPDPPLNSHEPIRPAPGHAGPGQACAQAPLFSPFGRSIPAPFAAK